MLGVVMSGCISAGRMPDAAMAWRSGAYGRAITLAQAEYERFRDGNDIAEAVVAADLSTLVELLRSTPIVLPDDEPPRAANHEEGLPRGQMADTLRRDLGSSGVVRVVRAVRSVMRLQVERHSQELLAMIWRRDPFADDHPAVAGLGTARRSLIVKRAALDALIELAKSPR